MPTPQSAIISESGDHALFLLLRVQPGSDTQLAVVNACAGIEDLVGQVQGSDADSGLVASVAFGAGFWDRIHPRARPAQLRPFTALRGAHDAPATGGDIFLHVHSQRSDLNFELARRWLKGLGDSVVPTDEVHGFRYLDSRDLTGFIDGTENPQGGERSEVALIGAEDPTFAGGSYVLVQRYIHDLRKWEQIPDSEQEKVIGRSKPDSVELDDEVRPATAHISRVVIEEDGRELEILRHSLPYGNASGESGLLFLAYSRDLSIFEKMLARMYGISGDQCSDHLMDFTRPVSGAFFFAPSREYLSQMALSG